MKDSEGAKFNAPLTSAQRLNPNLVLTSNKWQTGNGSTHVPGNNRAIKHM